MRKIILMTIFLCGLFFIGSSSVKAQIPPGSYQKSCSDIQVKSNVLLAICNPKSPFSLPGFPVGEKFKYQSNITDFFDCVGDISNSDGKLVCQKFKYPQKSPLMQAAEKAIAGAYPIYYGVSYPNNLGDTRFWVIKMIEGGFLNELFKGLKTIDAAAFIESYIKKPENANVRLALINKAFQDVYGTTNDASPKDVAFWNSQTSKMGNFYLDVISGEMKKLNDPGNKIVRRAMIMFAYKKMMGRNPTKEDIAYWETKTEIYKQIIAAGRNFLYAPNGSKDLAETVERALTEKMGAKPKVSQINEAIIKYTKTKAIFAEM